MDILGIGPLELIFILIIILIVMGPKDIVKSSRVVGKFLRSVMTHPTFRLVQDTSREIRNLPYRLAREAGVEELQKDLKNYTDLPSISPLEAEAPEAEVKEPEAATDDELAERDEPDLGSWEQPARPTSQESTAVEPETEPGNEPQDGSEPTEPEGNPAGEQTASGEGESD